MHVENRIRFNAFSNNILSNGLYALNPGIGGKRVPEISIGIFKETKWMVIETEDNGLGMDAETVKRVFEPFYTTEFEDIGTDLGLSLYLVLLSVSSTRVI